MKEMQFQLSEAVDPKLTDWINEPSLQDLKKDLEAAKPAHSAQMTKIKGWQELLNVTGSAKPEKVQGRSSVQPRLVRRQAEWRYAALSEPFLGSNKLFSVKPVSWDDVEGARQNDVVLNWQFRTKLNKVKFIDDYVHSVVDEGTGIIRLGWKRVTIKVPKEVPVWTHYAPDEAQAEMLQRGLAAHQENAEEFEKQAPDSLKQSVQFYHETGQATVAHQTGTQTIQVEKILENHPTVEVMDPNNVFIDPSCNGDIDKAMFVVCTFETCQADLLKEGKKYRNLDAVLWNSNGPAIEPDHETKTPQDFAVADDMRRKVVAYEYWGFWDIQNDGKLVPFVATWIGNVLIRMEVNPFPDEKVPFVVVPYMPLKRDLYGEPDAELLGDNQRIMGALTRGMIDLLGRSANGQEGMAKGLLDPVNKRKYERGQNYEFNPNIHPDQGIVQHKYPELPQSAILMTQMVNEEAEALTGVKSFSGGISGNAYGDVAAGIRGMLDAASKREMAILRRLAKGMVQIGEKIIAMNAVFLSDKEVIRVTSEEFVPINREDLKGNFDLEVDISTAEVDNAKSQDLAFMLQTIGPSADPKMAFMIMAEIAELKRMPALAHMLRNYQPPGPSPEQQQMMQLQLQEQQLKVAKLQAEIAHLGAKTGLENSRKDKLDLDYVEQETGTHHARDMQKMEAQAHGNQGLKIVESLLKPRKPEESKPDIKAALGFNQLSTSLMNQALGNAKLPLGS